MQQQNFPIEQVTAGAAEFRQCFKCNYEAVSPYTICPRCRCPKFLSQSSIRSRGMLSVGVGLFLVVFMIAIAAAVFILLAGASKDPGSAKKINGEIGMLLLIYGIFAAVIAFGANAIAGGLWMIIAGKRSRVFVWLMWATLALILVAGGIFRALAG